MPFLLAVYRVKHLVKRKIISYLYATYKKPSERTLWLLNILSYIWHLSEEKKMLTSGKLT